MIRFRQSLFQAALAVLLLSAPIRAGTIYSVFEGGASGTLEVEFETDVPITKAVLDQMPQNGNIGLPSFVDAPLLGHTLVPTKLGFGLERMFVNITPNRLAFGNVAAIYLVFPTIDVPSTPGTYALVAGNYGPSGGGSPNGSLLASGALHVGPNPGTILLDTLVISNDDPPSVPEPASFTLLGMGMALLGVVWIKSGYYWRTRKSRNCQAC